MKKINIVVFIVFAFIAFVGGLNHEPWADEAQSWIIARDANVEQIIWDISRYEGTFPLWFLTIKLFINFGLQYEYFFLIPIIISCIGLLVFLKRVEAPKFVKVLLPFTYYVLYQFTMVARSYSYLFLALSIWASLYKDRMNKRVKYALSLLFISMISMHGMVISGVLGIIFIIELLKTKEYKRVILPSIILVFTWIVECIILFPRADLYMNVAMIHSLKTVLNTVLSTVFTGTNIIEKIYIAIGIIGFIILIAMEFKLSKKDCLITIGALIVFMALIRLVQHHLGIIAMFVMFATIINYEELKTKYKHFEKFFVTILIVYISFSIFAVINEFNANYSGAKQMALYIEENNIDEKEIYRFGYKNVSLIPYFEKNLYSNTDKTIYEWKQSNKDFYEYVNFNKEKIKEKFKEIPEYILVEFDEINKKVKEINELIDETGLYELEYQSIGKQFYKCTYVDTESFNLYKLKNK